MEVQLNAAEQSLTAERQKRVVLEKELSDLKYKILIRRAEAQYAVPKIRVTLGSITQPSDESVLISGLAPGTQIQTVEPTQSMSPTITYGVKLIMSPVTNVTDLQVGDVISFVLPDGKYILHRIALISEGTEGWYCKTRADAGSDLDEWVVRSEDIHFVLRGILY